MSRKKWTDEKIFSRLINNKSDRTYWDNIRELRSRANAYIFNTCHKMIKSSKPKERAIAFDILAQLGISPRPYFKESRKLFFDTLKKEKNPTVLFSLLYAIGHNNENLHRGQIALLASFRDSVDDSVREGLVSSLLSVDNKLAIDTLIHLSNDRVAHIRDWATFGLGTQLDSDNKMIREALWKRTDDKDLATKFEAIVGLARRKDSRVKRLIEQELMNGQYDTLLFEAIEELNDKSLISLLQQ